MLGKDVYSCSWDLRGVVGAGSPGSTSGHIPAGVADAPGEVQRDSSRILMLPAPGNGRG